MRVVLPGILLLSWVGGTSFAQTSGSAFLNITSSARSYALGMSSVVSALGAQSLGANPANMGLMPQRFDVLTSYATLMDGTQFQHVAASLVPSAYDLIDGIGLAVTRLETTGFETADAAGNRTGGTFNSSAIAGTFGGSARLGSGLRLGLAGKAIQERIAGYKSNIAVAADLGTSYTLSSFKRPVTLAFSLDNIGQTTKFRRQADPLPTSVNLGLALPVGAFLAVFEANHMIYDKRTEFGSGLEFPIGPAAFRLGYLAQNSSGNLALNDSTRASRFMNGMTAGLGIKTGAFRFDYAVNQQAVEFGPAQSVSLSMQWGGKARESPAGADKADWKPSPEKSDWLLRGLGGY